MFAQQVMNMYNSRQPMGILASSPELMGAVQNYAGGGAVKGYQDGGIQKINIDSAGVADLNKRIQNLEMTPNAQGTIQIVVNRANQKFANVEFDPKTKQFIMKPTDVEGGVVTATQSEKDAIADKQKAQILGKNLATVEKEIKDQEKADQEKADQEKLNISQVDEFGEDKKFPDSVEGGTPGAKINEVNKEIIDKKAEEEEAPKPKKKDTSDIDAKIQAASNSYEGYKSKLAKTDKTFQANEATRTDFMTKIQGLIEEKEDEISLDDVDKKAREVLGLKEGEKYDEDRVAAFWMSMIKGGLATAAGESSNALTNIAKGLMFGVDSYGKDLNRINAQEAEDRKSLAKMKYDLLKDEKAAKVAERTLKLQAYGELAKLEEQKFQFKTKFEYDAARNEILDNLAMAKVDLTAMQVLNAMKMGDLNYEAKIREISLNEKKQDDYVKLTEKQLSQQLRDKNSTKEIKNIFALGSDYATYEDGEFKFTDKGKSMLIAATANKTKFTDLVTTAKSVAATGKIRGYKFDSPEATEKAYYYYEGITKPAIAALSKTEKGLTGLDKEAIATKTQELLDQFAKDTGGTLEGAGGSTSFTTGDIAVQNGKRFQYQSDGTWKPL